MSVLEAQSSEDLCLSRKSIRERISHEIYISIVILFSSSSPIPCCIYKSCSRCAFLRCTILSHFRGSCCSNFLFPSFPLRLSKYFSDSIPLFLPSSNLSRSSFIFPESLAPTVHIACHMMLSIHTGTGKNMEF